MANVSASFLGYAYYNNGWNPATNTASDFYTTSANYGMPIAGKNNYWRYGVFKISFPSITGPSSGRRLYFNMSLYSGSTGNISFYVTVAKVGRAMSDSAGGGKEATYPSDSDIIIKSQPITCYMNSSGYNRVAFDFDASSMPSSGGTYYIWIWGNNLLYFQYDANITEKTFVCSMSYTPYTACGAPTILALNKVRVIPGGDAILSWSGATTGVSTTIKGYTIYYSDDSGSTWSWMKFISTPATSGSTNVTNWTRGSTRYFCVVTNCAQGSEYDSGRSKRSSALRANTLPYFSVNPALSTNYLPLAGGNIILSWTAADAESTPTVRYKINNGDWTAGTASGTYTYKATASGKFYIYAVDDLGESSEVIELAFTINTPPVISNFSISPVIIEGNSTVPLVERFSANATVTKTNVSYEWLVSIAGVSENYTISTDKNLSDYRITSGGEFALYLTEGKTYKVGLRVNDGYDTSPISWSSSYRRPFTLEAPKIIGFYNGGSISAPSTISGTQSDQYGTHYFLKIKNPTVGDGYPNISKVEVKTAWGNYRFSSNASAAEQTIQINGSSVTPGNKDNAVITVTSSGGHTSITTGSIVRAIIPSLSGATLNMTGPKEGNKVSIRPFTNTSSVSFTSGIGNYSQCQNGFNWVVGYSYDDKEPLTIDLTPTTISGSTMTTNLTASEVNTLFLNSYFESSEGVFNADYDITVSLYAVDNFGQSSNVLYFSGARVLYVEAPVMSATSASVGINYVPSSASYVNILSSSSTNEQRMINDGENVYLTFPAATDYNKDLSGYFVNVAELDSAPAGNYSVYFTTPSNHPINGFYPTVTTSGNNAILQYTLGNYSAHKFLIFQIWAIDKGGRTSKTCAYSSTYLIACRRAIPQLRIDSATSRIESGTTIKNYLDVQIKINDLGDCYNEGAVLSGSYIKNFERTIVSNGIAYANKRKMLIEITYSLQDGFPTSSTLTKVASISLTSNFHDYNGAFTIELPSNFVGKRLYLKARISVTTGYGTDTLGETSGITYVTNISSPYVYFSIMPTITYRAHHLGINTNVFDSLLDNEVLKISDTETRGIIRMVGTEGSGASAQDHEIVVNLKDGTITGDNIYSVKIVKWTSS